MLNSVSEYPHWLVVTCTVFAAVFVLWIIVKIIKVALWVSIVGVLVAAALYATWLLLR